MESESILDFCKKKKIKSAEVFIFKGKSFLAEIRNHEVESSKSADTSGVGIRVIQDNKLGFAYSTSTDKKGIEETIDRAIINSKSNVADEFNILPGPDTTGSISGNLKNLNIRDSKYDSLTVEQKIEKAKNAEVIARNFDSRIKDVRHSLYQDISYEVNLINTYGINCSFSATLYVLSLLALASDGTDNEISGESVEARFFDELNEEEVGRESARNAVSLLGARSISSRKIDLVIPPIIGAEIVSVISSMLLADSIAKGKSLFKNKIGDKVASDQITVIDDGILSKGLGTSPFDGEGVPPQKNILIDKGKLINIMHNTYTASKSNKKSTGNATRSSFRGLPEVGPTNFFIETGTIKKVDLIRKVKDGLYIIDVMGMHTVNPISGDFSVGVSGLLIENGEFSRPVREITIAGNILEILSKITVVADDIKFYGGFGSPTFIAREISLAGRG